MQDGKSRDPDHFDPPSLATALSPNGLEACERFLSYQRGYQRSSGGRRTDFIHGTWGQGGGMI